MCSRDMQSRHAPRTERCFFSGRVSGAKRRPCRSRRQALLAFGASCHTWSLLAAGTSLRWQAIHHRNEDDMDETQADQSIRRFAIKTAIVAVAVTASGWILGAGLDSLIDARV